jgi:chromosomal replication initiator protein
MKELLIGLPHSIYNDIIKIEKTDQGATIIIMDASGNHKEYQGEQRDIVSEIIRDFGLPKYTVKEICDIAIDCSLLHSNLTANDIKVKTRKREQVTRRQIAMTLVLTRFKYIISLEAIGGYIGNKNHATVLHAAKTVNNLCETDKSFLNLYNEMNEKFLDLVKTEIYGRKIN